VKTLTVRLPESLAAEIDREATTRRVSKSDVIRDRLQAGAPPSRLDGARLDAIADLVGSIDAMPRDLSTRKKDALKATGYGRKRPR